MNSHQKPDFYPLVSMRRLERLLYCSRAEIGNLAKHAGSYYRPFLKVDKRSGKERPIDNPIEPLKSIQKRIKNSILQKIPIPAGITGGVKGRSLHDNLKPHVNKAQVSCVDIRKFFHNVSNVSVYWIYIRFFGCSPAIASLLTRLTTLRRCLPQGAPTSTPLAALALIPLYWDLKNLLAPQGIQVTIWVDDITMSGPEHRKMIAPAIELVRSYGYSLPNRKISIFPRHTRQWVTGAAVNRKTTIGKERRRKYRSDLLGLDPSSTSDHSKAKSKILFARSLCSHQGEALERLWRKHASAHSKNVLGGNG